MPSLSLESPYEIKRREVDVGDDGIEAARTHRRDELFTRRKRKAAADLARAEARPKEDVVDRRLQPVRHQEPAVLH